MATTKHTSNENATAVFNDVMSSMTTTAQDAVGYSKGTPVVASALSTAIGEVVNNPNVKNMFVNVLFNKYVKTIFSDKVWKNKFAQFKGEKVTNGNYIENIHVNPAETLEFTNNGSVSPFEKKKSDVKVEYYLMNDAKTWKVTVSEEQLATAFTTDANLKRFIDQQVNTLYNAWYKYEYDTTMDLLNKGIESGFIQSRTIPNFITDATKTIDAVEQCELAIANFEYLGSEYNGYKVAHPEDVDGFVETFTDKKDVILIMTDQMKTRYGKRVLASAFNRSDMELENKIVTVKEFADPNVVCIVCDRALLQLRDYKVAFRSLENPNDLDLTIWLHVMSSYSLNSFVNALVLKV